jgi:hypothetical protein
MIIIIIIIIIATFIGPTTHPAFHGLARVLLPDGPKLRQGVVVVAVLVSACTNNLKLCNNIHILRYDGLFRCFVS